MFNLFNNQNINQNINKKDENTNIQNNQNSKSDFQENSTAQIKVISNFETLQKARQDLMGEIQAIIEYDNHIHTTNDKVAMETWENIKHEELTHVGELLSLIAYLSPEDEKYVQKGINEFMERMNRK